MDKITFANPFQVLLWQEEISGQISDGHWENARPYDHWERPCKAKVTWSADHIQQGANFKMKRYNLTDKDLLEIVEDRMMASVRVEKWLTLTPFDGEIFDMFKHAAQGWESEEYKLIKRAAKMTEEEAWRHYDEASKAHKALDNLKMADKAVQNYAATHYDKMQKLYNAKRKCVAEGITPEVIAEFENAAQDESLYSKKELMKDLREMKKILRRE